MKMIDITERPAARIVAIAPRRSLPMRPQQVSMFDNRLTPLQGTLLPRLRAVCLGAGCGVWHGTLADMRVAVALAALTLDDLRTMHTLKAIRLIELSGGGLFVSWQDGL